jgi:ABC-type polysaccharide transport system permease subunit
MLRFLENVKCLFRFLRIEKVNIVSSRPMNLRIKSSVDFMGMPQYFRALFVGNAMWKGLGCGAIIYLVALAAANEPNHSLYRIFSYFL